MIYEVVKSFSDSGNYFEIGSKVSASDIVINMPANVLELRPPLGSQTQVRNVVASDYLKQISEEDNDMLNPDAAKEPTGTQELPEKNEMLKQETEDKFLKNPFLELTPASIHWTVYPAVWAGLGLVGYKFINRKNIATLGTFLGFLAIALSYATYKKVISTIKTEKNDN